MAYIKTTWVNGSAPPINATNLNKIEDGIEDVTDDLDTHVVLESTLSDLGHVQNGVITATITTASWTGTTSPFTSITTVSGIQSNDVPIIDIVMSGTFADDEVFIEEWAYVYRAVTTTDSVTFSATDLPTVDLPIQLKVVR
jgi:hypothetical protein